MDRGKVETMLVIHKYNIGYYTQETIKIPEGAYFLSVQLQNNILAVWAVIEKDNPLTDYTFYIYGTGQEVEEFKGFYLGTVQKGNYVWHVFYE